MDQQTPTRYSDVAEWKLESSWWQGVSSDIKGCLSGRERKFLNGDLLLLFLITVFVIRSDNTITITGGQNSCGWSPVYWFFCYEWSVIYRIIVEYLLCEFSMFNIFNELLSAKIEKIELTDKRVNPCCEMCWDLPSTTQW